MVPATKPALSDPDVYPSDEVLDAILGPARPAYDALLDFLRAEYPDAVGAWKYYRDGGRWLLNVSRGKKGTVFWLTADPGSFRTTFYLASRHEDRVLESGLPEPLKEQYRASAGRKFRGITVTVRTVDDLDAWKVLVPIKLDALRS